jgi:hypothetical protein
MPPQHGHASIEEGTVRPCTTDSLTLCDYVTERPARNTPHVGSIKRADAAMIHIDHLFSFLHSLARYTISERTHSFVIFLDIDGWFETGTCVLLRHGASHIRISSLFNTHHCLSPSSRVYCLLSPDHARLTTHLHLALPTFTAPCPAVRLPPPNAKVSTQASQRYNTFPLAPSLSVCNTTHNLQPHLQSSRQTVRTQFRRR